MKQEWKERLFKAIIEAVIAFITAFTVASCTVAAVADKETENIVEKVLPGASKGYHYPGYLLPGVRLIDFSHDDSIH